MLFLWWSLLYTSLQTQPVFEPQILDATISIGYGLAIGDVDGDKKPDILLADKKQFVWYRNGDWKRFIMAENLTEHDNVCIAARDIDGDGKVEVAVGAQWNPGETTDHTRSGAVFYLIRPRDPTSLWKSVRLHHEPTIHRMRWAKVGSNQYQLIVVPLHGRGNQNGQGAGVKVLAFDKPKNPDAEWNYQIVDSTLHLTHNFEILEDKNTTQLWLASQEGVKVLSYIRGHWQPAAQSEWLQQGNGAGEIRRGMFTDTKAFAAAVEPMHGNRLVVYRPDDVRFRHVLKEDLNQGHAVACTDLLGLGNTQVVVGWRAPNADKKVGIRLFIPTDTTAKTWQEHTIDDNQMACEDLQVADLNADGKPDIIASGRDTHNLIVYWNRSR